MSDNQELHLPIHDLVSAFITKLTSLNPSLHSIWLIGSRANQRYREESDTDLLIFGSKDLLCIARDQLEPPSNLDCLIVFNGNDFQDPWKNKKGRLDDFEWQETSNISAKYVGVKWISSPESATDFDSDEECLIHRQEQAFRIWPAR